jgi:plastocyanin
MNNLDSRLLRYTDTFVKRFAKPGHVEYRLVIGGATLLSVERDSFTIDVNPRRGAEEKRGKQHTVIVRREGRRLVAEPSHLEVEAGDMVLWHAPDPATPGFAVHGRMEQKKERFDSTALSDETIYSHAFGLPGDYHWIDAYGRDLSGVVHVADLDDAKGKAAHRWQKALHAGTTIKISGDHIEPQKVEILVGQTVFWIVEEADGISITDARLARRKRPQKGGSKAAR